MLKIQLYFTILILFVFLSSCILISNSKELNKKPDWIYHYHIEGKVCGVGSSLPHIKGFAYQQATAIARAIDQIAMQKGVKVETSLEHFLSGTKNSSHSDISIYSVQTTDGQNVKATVKDTWQDLKTKILYVWMYSE